MAMVMAGTASGPDAAVAANSAVTVVPMFAPTVKG